MTQIKGTRLGNVSKPGVNCHHGNNSVVLVLLGIFFKVTPDMLKSAAKIRLFSFWGSLKLPAGDCGCVAGLTKRCVTPSLGYTL